MQPERFRRVLGDAVTHRQPGGDRAKIAGSLGPTLVALCTDYIAHSEGDLRYVIFGVRMIAGMGRAD